MNGPDGTPVQDALNFPARFAARFGRPLRVLHIGNVANYAFVNTRIQRRAGIDADCIDPNFFHIMACPEWLEASIEGDHGDDFAPKWSRVSLNGYRRPPWFVQGDEKLAFQYLEAKNANRAGDCRRLLRLLELHRQAFTNDTPLPHGLMQHLMKSEHPIMRRVRGGLKALARTDFRRRKRGNQWAATHASEDDFLIRPPIEVMAFVNHADDYREVLSYYDVIHGYTVQAVYPAAAGLPNFLSYELGTIRGLPFEDSPMGRLTRWVYLNSPEVFITNTDCMPAAERLGLDMRHVHKALHAFDVDDAIEFATKWREPPNLDEVPVFYAPARQHWKFGNDSILKGNDVAIRGAALLRERGHKFQLVLGEWGSEVDLTKELIAELNLHDCIGWTKPLPRQKLWPTYLRARAIIDQFKSPAFGGVSLEAMALGKRLITGYDHSYGGMFFSQPPPILNCRTPEAVADAMEQCMLDPGDDRGLGRAAQAWMQQEHGVDRQLRDQFRVYEKLLASLSYRDGRWQLPSGRQHGLA